MNKMNKIWDENITGKDRYLDFTGSFRTKKGRVQIKISCDDAFAFYIAGKLAGFGSCPNYPHRKIYYGFDITKFCEKNAENKITITVWHKGENSQTGIAQNAYLAFEITENGKRVLKSDDKILCRQNDFYKNVLCKKITNQMGYGFACDFTANKNAYKKATDYGKDKFIFSGINTIKLSESMAVQNQTTPQNATTEQSIQTIQLTKKGSILIDLKKEVVGFLEIDIDSDKKRKIKISYSEHLVGGRVESKIGERDFSIELTLKQGENKALMPFRRVAGRYLEITGEEKTGEGLEGIKINHIAIRQVEYPTKKIKREIKDELLQRIYDTCIYTLKCCMHEHYEDCPWREQALYTLDRRNQMLCGYYAFTGHNYQRANLLLIADGIRKDGLLSLCFPAGIDYPIPFFSLVYIMQTAEYIEHTGDRAILRQTGNTLKKIMATFTKRIEKNNLIANFEEPYWNFYEWTEGSSNDSDLSGKERGKEKQYDLILNCFYIIASSYYDKIFGTKTDTREIKKAIRENFYNSEKGLFRLSTASELFSETGNAMAILSGVCGEDEAKIIAEQITGQKIETKASLSMLTFIYDALLKVDKDKYAPYIIDDIKQKYQKMTEETSTVWETLIGWRDFGGAGSLCHGWSAMPVYYIATLYKN